MTAACFGFGAHLYLVDQSGVVSQIHRLISKISHGIPNHEVAPSAMGGFEPAFGETVGTMGLFASNTVNNVDKKGRVSIPAPFRTTLGGEAMLRGLLSIDHPVVEAGGKAMMQQYERRLDMLDPFSQAYEDWSHYLLGDALELKLDGEGRIAISERLREHTGIGEQVLFEGRGNSFWMWEPSKYDAYRRQARARVRDLRAGLVATPPAAVSTGARTR